MFPSFFANFVDSNGNHRDCRREKRTEITYVLQANLNEIFSHVEDIESTLSEERRALIIRPLICISLKKNGEH